MSYRKIVQIGASSAVGSSVLAALSASGNFEITVVARHTSTFDAPNDSVKVVKVDFSDHRSLVNTLRGNDAVALTFGDLPNIEKNTKALIDAAIEAGVKRVLPSEYGGDLARSPGREEPIFGSKANIHDYLSEKSSEGAIEFTTIANGSFFDWGLTHIQAMGFDIPNRTATIYNGGDDPVNATTLDTIGAAVVSVLSSPERFKNKHLRISDFYVSQNEILAILEAETGSNFTIEKVDAEKLRDDSYAGLGRGDFSHANTFGAVKGAVFGQKSCSRWGRGDDTEDLGIPRKDLTQEIRKIL